MPLPFPSFSLTLNDALGVEEQKRSTPIYAWQYVGVLGYSPEKKQYMVQKADHNGCVRDSNGRPVVGGAQINKGKSQRVKESSKSIIRLQALLLMDI